ncbi:hypothetical protein H5410_025781 [Solanum commersonii]|uniref:Uncharacterized protein n=1 Tax=Solanum commersonii TaxID=4109 RepID=A0A9J5YUQ5_SOLCO|nr:hypothetical protein H5410_025781 [Solanum commersonii]
MLKTQKHADDIMNGLVNHMGFLLLYTMSGLTLQGSNHVGCLGALDNGLQNDKIKIGENTIDC